MKFLHWQGPVAFRSAKYVVGICGHQWGDIVQSLVGHNSIYYGERGAHTLQLGEVPCERRRVMAYVADYLRMLAKRFPSSAKSGAPGGMLYCLGFSFYSKKG